MNHRINKLLNHPKYVEYLNKISNHEAGRLFCTHDLTHFLDTARIAYILNLENNLNIPKDLIYGAALLHDIGKWQQYENGISHEVASGTLCVELLCDAGYKSKEVDLIKSAILSHRNPSVEGTKDLLGIIYVADKLSRKCYNCKMTNQCDWSDEKKNFNISY
ncbi:MAG: hypothetical protein CVV02_01780 [Firmicutes bacterium HGW-Firmicutes-7]|nr:MAG: hypothetical protein CVV02_01780 [Firmicutes bacterium HGW-Firmicutes-7]